MRKIPVVAFDTKVAKVAIALNRQLKQKRTLIDIADLFIAATAIKSGLPLATLNTYKQIDLIPNLLKST